MNQLLASLPKVELHLHLDCSLSYAVVQQLNPAIGYDEWWQSFVAPTKCTDLADYISRAVKGFELMQTPEQLRLVTLDLMEQLKNDRVIYAEIRFAPLQHTRQGMSPEQVVGAVCDAMHEGIAQTGVKAGIILCTLRHFTEIQGLETAKLAEEFAAKGVVGFDIAADEAGFPIDPHVAAFAYAKSKGIKCTAHAGEARGAESVWETMEKLRPLRIGHGVRSAEDEKLLQYLCEHQVHLEVCPTSNIQTNVFDTMAQHSASRIFESGVSMSINTDARTTTPVTLASEYELMLEQPGWTLERLLHCNLEAVKHCFATEELKARLRAQIKEAWNRGVYAP
jgi:adenosine deaminase